MVFRKRQKKKYEIKIKLLKRRLRKLELKKSSLNTRNEIEKSNEISRLKLELVNLEKKIVVDQFELLLEESHRRQNKVDSNKKV